MGAVHYVSCLILGMFMDDHENKRRKKTKKAAAVVRMSGRLPNATAPNLTQALKVRALALLLQQ